MKVFKSYSFEEENLIEKEILIERELCELFPAEWLRNFALWLCDVSSRPNLDDKPSDEIRLSLLNLFHCNVYAKPACFVYFRVLSYDP